MAYIVLAFASIVQLALFIFHLFEYEVIVTVFNVTNPATLHTLQIALGLLSISFVPASLIENLHNNIFTRTLYRLAAVWLGFLNYLVITAMVFYIALAILLPFGWGMATVRLIGRALFAAAIVIALYGLYNARRIAVARLEVKSDKLPRSWRGRRAVWVSDLQLGQIYGRRFSERIAEKIRKLDPDILFVGGDLYDGVAIDLDDSIRSFAELKPSLGKYFILGNHEEFSDNAKYLEAVQRAGMRALVDESLEVDGIQLVGVDYKSTSKRASFRHILGELIRDKNKFYILLKHSPSYVDVAEQEGIGLMISGHTHQAQMWPYNYVTRLIYKGYDHGLHRVGQMLQYTSSGTGTWGPPLRVGTRSEIVLIDFR